MFRHANHQTVRIVILTALVGAAFGCSVTGTWRLARVEPQAAAFPIELLTLDEHGRFTATGPGDAQRRTRTGTYAFRGGELRLMSVGAAEERYPSHRLPSGSWRLSSIPEPGSAPVHATFRRVKE